VKHPLQLEPADAAFEALGIPLDILRGALVVLAFSELEQLGRIGNGFGGAVQLGQLGSQLGAFPAQLLGLVGRLPDGRVFELPVYFFEAFFLDVVLKETP